MPRIRAIRFRWPTAWLRSVVTSTTVRRSAASREPEPHSMSGENGSHARLDAILTRAALTRPQRAAVIFQDITWTYGEVHDRARRLAGALAALGVQKGDRVALWAANRAEFVEVLFGVPMLGAIASPLDHWWTWKDAHDALAQIRPRVLIVGAPAGSFSPGSRRRDACRGHRARAAPRRWLCESARRGDAAEHADAGRSTAIPRSSSSLPVLPDAPRERSTRTPA